MPLEQIRPVAALNSSESLRRASYFDYPSSSAPHSPFARDVDGSGSDREHADDDGDDDYSERYKRYSSSSRKSESMSLAKLGGVGGVTRSGSWGRNSLPETSLSARQAGDDARTSHFKPHRSSLARYREDPEDDEDDQVGSTDSAESSALPTSFSSAAKNVPNRRSSDEDFVTNAISSRTDPRLSTSAETANSSKAPASSRTSTASSAAAFSLRSLSNRTSTGSVSSLASSVVSRGELDRLTPAPPVESPIAIDATTAAKSHSDSTLTSSSSATSVTAPSSPARTQAVDVTTRDDDEGSHAEDGSDAPSQDTAEPPSPPANASIGGATQLGKAFESPQATASAPLPADPQATSDKEAEREDRPAAAAQPLSSPATRPRPPVGSPASAASMQPSAEELLTSTAASMYSPLVPRRHSGMIMLRSRSQLALHAGLTMTFASADGGRAAARERARKQTGWENAPFSVLEAQRHARSFAYSQPASPGTTATSIAWDPSSTTPLLQPAANVAEPAGIRSPKLSARPVERSVPSPQSPPAIQPPVRSTDGPGPVPRPNPLSRQKSEHTLSRAALARLDTVLGFFGNDAPEPTLPASADAATTSMPTGARMQPVRSPSGSVIVGANGLLRTPTTEEWSRYLESQGVGLSGRRSRTGTNLSSSSSALRGSRLALSGLQSSSKVDLDAAAADYEDSDLDSDDSDDHEIGVEVLEKLRQLGLSRAASRAGSVLGDELASLHEEDEDNLSPVSPQVNQILPQADLTPLTPLASSAKALPQNQGTPVTLLNGSPSTPQPVIDRGPTLRLPRSKRPTVSSDLQGGGHLYPHDYKGEKSIADFEIVSDVGRGAYGLVKKARKKGPDGRPQGEEVVIKYIIKSRILADCWRRHRVLGPIPVEIHVMDQLRRIAYVAPTKPRPWAPKRPKTLEEYRARKRLETEREEALAQTGAPAAAAATSTSHPNICRMLDFFEDHEFYYLVMPCFGRGQDLFDYVESAPDGLAASQCRSIFGQVADALWFLHANNIVHRDIKDENVILDGEGNAQLIDFGSAAHVRPGKLFDTFSGTLDYAAAEILQGEKYAGQAQDVWALGVVGFVLLCGECPFWNGEEAVQGLEEGTRAAQTLQERCMIARGGPADPEKDLADQQLDMAPLDPAWSPCKDKEGAEPDGGGRVDDFVDLISRCLELDPELRPSAEQICQHRFLAGYAGWTGRQGWQRLKAPIVPSCTSTGEGKGIPTAAAAAAAAAGAVTGS